MASDPLRPPPPPPPEARLTPFELAFSGPDFDSRLFPLLQEEARSAGSDPANPARFGFLTHAADALRELVPHETPPEQLDQHRALLYQAFNFWRLGKRVYLFEKAVLRFLVEAAPGMEGWSLELPHPAVYLQLPSNLFWAQVTPDSVPEPVDGIFATAFSDADVLGEPFQSVEALLVLGIRRQREGFSVIPFRTETGPGINPGWGAEPARPTGGDFANILPGGEIDGLYSVLTTTEALKLLARCCWYLAKHPEEVEAEPPPAEPAAATPEHARDSHLPFYRVTFGSGG